MHNTKDRSRRRCLKARSEFCSFVSILCSSLRFIRLPALFLTHFIFFRKHNVIFRCSVLTLSCFLVQVPNAASTHAEVVSFFRAALGGIAEFEHVIVAIEKDKTLTGTIFVQNCNSPQDLVDLFEDVDPPIKVRHAKAIFAKLFPALTGQ